jgi:hypothetical protein
MDSNTDSTGRPARSGAQSPDGLAALTAAIEGLAAQNLDGLSDAVRAERVLVLRGLLDRLEGQWLEELAGVDARGAAVPNTTSRLAPPRAGCAPGCAWVPAPPTAVSAPPEPCSAVR